MFGFGEKHPVVFEIILIIAALLGAAVFAVAGSILDLQAELGSSVGRIVVAILLLIIFARAFKGGRFFTAPGYLLPGLLFAGWNLFYNLSSGMEFGGAVIFIEAVITALAPALFEEVIFRGIAIYNLKKKGHGDFACLFISAIIFALIHVTNLVGQDLISVGLQVGYSFVVGLVLAAIYLKNRSLLQIVLIHFLIDFTNRIYVSQPSTASYVQMGIFAAVLVVEFIYALWLTARKKD